LGLGLVLGGIAGAWGAGAFAGGATPTVATPTNTPIDPPVDPAKEKERPSVSPPMQDDPEAMLVMAFGELEVDEPKDGVQHLKPGPWTLRVGSTFTTGDSLAGIYAYANDVGVRLDRDSKARVLPNDVQLLRGQAWIYCGQRGETVRVEVGDTIVQVIAGAAICNRACDPPAIVALDGKVTVRSARGELLTLAPKERALLDDGRGARKEPMPFVASAMAWMTPMIRQSTDPEELPTLIRELIAAFEQGEYRDEARAQLLQIGSQCVPAVSESIERLTATDRRTALAAATLLAHVVDFGYAKYAIQLLLLDDADVRAAVFTGLRDRTEQDNGTDETFWRTASEPNRKAAVERWLRKK